MNLPFGGLPKSGSDVGRPRVLAKWIGQTRAAGVLVGMMLFTACEIECDNEALLHAKSSSGDREAMVFRRSCGATTGFSTHVSILETSAALPDDGGNALVLDDDHPLALKWSGTRTLQISGPNHQRIFKRDERVSDVRITFKGLRSLGAGE